MGTDPILNKWGLSLFFLPGLELGPRFFVRRVEPEDRASFLHLGFDPVLELGLLRGFRGHFVGELRRDHHHALGVADHHVARIDRHAAAADRHLAVDRVVAHQVERRRARAAVDPEGELLDGDRKSTRLNSSHGYISYAVFCLKKKKKKNETSTKHL